MRVELRHVRGAGLGKAHDHLDHGRPLLSLGGPRILSVVTQLESGGAQTVAVELHREFARRSLPSELVFLYEKDKGAFPRRDFATCLDHAMRTPVDLLRIAARLRAAWRAFRPTAIIAHTHFTINLCALVKATGLGGRLLAVHHNVYESYPASSRALDRMAGALGLYAGEISVSDPVLRSLGRGGGEREVIINGQSLAASALTRAQARQSFGFAANDFLIGNIGRLSEQKNQGFLVDLLPALPGARLVILGEGHLRGALLAKAERLGVADRTILLGSVVHERVPDFLAALDVFAMPSLYEGMSIAMLEALAAGVPFIGTDVPTIAEVVGAGAAGLVAPLDPARWIAEITKLRDDPTHRATLGARQVARAADFSIGTMADRYVAAAARAA